MDLSPILAFLRDHPLIASILKGALGVLLTLVAARVFLRILAAARDRILARIASRGSTSDPVAAEQTYRLETVTRVSYDVSRIIVYGFVVLTALAQFGVSIQPLLAGAGLVGAAIALGSQAIVKDFVAGCFILLEGHFSIGDQITVSPTLAGTVERMTLRMTMLRDVDGAVHVIPNGTIAAVTNRTYEWSTAVVPLSVAATADLSLTRETLEKAARAATARDTDKVTLLADVTVAGPTNLKGTAVEWTFSAKVRPGEASKAKAWIIEEALRALSAAGISVV